ncbi:hypothetical protein [Nocardia sp. IFM 10818]
MLSTLAQQVSSTLASDVGTIGRDILAIGQAAVQLAQDLISVTTPDHVPGGAGAGPNPGAGAPPAQYPLN